MPDPEIQPPAGAAPPRSWKEEVEDKHRTLLMSLLVERYGSMPRRTTHQEYARMDVDERPGP